ncbi:MAG: hypothetical protein CMD33_02660 [Flavobacteriales bacterium]|nr:hypothetical protein [Flavobacteriales bacterium]
MANMKKILLFMVLTGACQAVFAQSQMTIPRVLQPQTSTNPDGTIKSINLELNPFDVQFANDSVELLHQRMGTNLSYGSLSGMSDGVTVQSFMTSYGTLNVTGAAALGSTLDVSGAFGVDGDFDVATNKFTVNAVSGNTAASGTMDVTGATTLSSTLDVSGATGVDGDFDVATNKFTVNAVSGNTAVGGTMDVTGAATLNGQVTINGNAASSFSASDHPSALIIDLVGSDPHRNTNYIQFEAGDDVLGRVEGMNMTQEWASYGTAFQNVLTCSAGALIGTVTNSGMGMIAGATNFNDDNADYDDYSSGQGPTDALSDLLGVFTTNFGIGLVDGSITLVKDIVSAIVEIWGCFYLGAGADDLATTLVDVIDDAASLGLHVYGSYGWAGSGVGNGGVAFESCGADYAEWLQKADPTAIYTPGDVLGVSAGEVGKEIENPERYMVVSTNPTVIGAMPGQEATSAYSKIAFMGQVPTKVLGEVERGDFILPSGNNDGYGVGVHPSKMQTSDYKWIIGTAWSESQPGAMTSVVNVAVGLNENEVTRQVEKIEASVVKIENALARLDPTYTPLVTQGNSTPRIATNTLQSQKVGAIAANMKMQGGDKKKEAQIKAIFNNALKLAQDAGVDLNSLPYLAEVFEDPLNVSVRENAIARLNERQAQLQFIQKELKRNVKSSEKAEGRDETVEASDPFILLQPQK